MEDGFSLGPAPAARHLFQQLVVNLPKNIRGPHRIGTLRSSGCKAGKPLPSEKSGVDIKAIGWTSRLLSKTGRSF